MSGLLVLADSVGRELQRLLPTQRKTQRVNLALVVATMLDVRSATLMDLAAGLPRPVERIDMRFQWIWRVVMNPLIKPDDVIAPFATERMALMAEQGEPLVLPGSNQDQPAPPDADAGTAHRPAGIAGGLARRRDARGHRLRGPEGLARREPSPGCRPRPRSA